MRDRKDAIAAVDCPFPIAGFGVSMLWHERNHSHSGQRWIREMLIELAEKL